ncbi:MAG: retropepsin-like aspartic protease [Phycisphaerales bacterium]|nr:retropepsin-like aspartic protease [Phycisphaerales bacterium]
MYIRLHLFIFFVVATIITCALSGCGGCSRSGHLMEINADNVDQYSTNNTVNNPPANNTNNNPPQQVSPPNNNTNNSPTNDPANNQRNNTGSKEVVQMQKYNGDYKVPVVVNGELIYFIFDTGASDVVISTTEARFLFKQGLLTDDDFIGTSAYTVANGDIDTGAVIILRSVKIGATTMYNVNASIVDNGAADCLLGETFLSRFGKVSIDYTNGTISFE